jgi:tRNA-splicing ligase RtcB
LLRTGLTVDEVRGRLDEIMTRLDAKIPRGIGKGGVLRATARDLDAVLAQGPRYLLEKGWGEENDVAFCEDQGKTSGADPDRIESRARQRGLPQLGSLGAGNHFLEIQRVEEIFDDRLAGGYSVRAGEIVVMIHTGSRGLGHQTCTDELRRMEKAMVRHGIRVPDRQLACVPVESDEGKAYLGAMGAAANFARANRHLLGAEVRECFREVFGAAARAETLYDVSHNLAKLEDFEVGDRHIPLCVHRKGATRAFGAGHPDLPEAYRALGQPVIIPGSMGTASYLLAGLGARETFASTCHGAGRTMSRKKAKAIRSGAQVRADLEASGISVRPGSVALLAEEAPYAYKDVSEVVRVCEAAGLSKVVARLKPMGVVKG